MMRRDEHKQYAIPLFDPTKIKNDAVWIILGPRNTGKTVLLRYLMWLLRDKCDMIMAMTETESSAASMRDYIPKRLVYNRGYDGAACDKFLNTTKMIAETGKVRHVWLIEDDLMSDSRFLSGRTHMAMHLNGRHWHESIFSTSQFPTCHPPKARAQADVVISLRCNSHADRRRLFEFYFGCFSSFAEFERVFAACTANYGCLVIDKTSPDTSVEGCIRHFRADPSKVPARFQVGKNIFFELSDFIDRQVEEARRKKEQEKNNNNGTAKIVM